MSNAIVSPFDLILAAAAASVPSNEISIKAQRINASGVDQVLLIDCSGSMGEFIDGLRKIEILRSAIHQLDLKEWRFFVFNSSVKECRSLVEPSGGTDMAQAIEFAIKNSRPRHTLIISDGLPDSRLDALASARRLPGVISTLFIGHDANTKAIEFMARLARLGCGKAHVQNLEYGDKQLMAAIKLLGGV